MVVKMKQETKLEIEELEKRRSILCDEGESLEQELRQCEDEIEGIDIKISRLKRLYQMPTRKEE